MYCIKCGVKLAETEKICPLCQTRAFHPDLEPEQRSPLYPTGVPKERPESKAIQFLLTGIWLLPMLLVFLVDWQFHQAVTWSGYVIGALLLSYLIAILPSWFKKPNPVIFTPCVFAGILVYLLYINWNTDGNWFLSFAFPVTGGVALIVTAVVTLMRYIPKGIFFILGGAMIAMGSFMLLVEFLLNLTFTISTGLGWSLYPLVVLSILGGLLIYLGVSRPAREMLERKFFI